MTRSLRALALCVLLALTFATAVAPAATPGKWRGNSVDSSGKKLSGKVKFSVSKSGKRIKKWSLKTLVVYCIPNVFDSSQNHFEFVTAYVPSAKIKSGGKFSRKYAIRDQNNELGDVTLKGKVGSRRAKGSVKYSGPGGCAGKVAWKAKLKS